MRGLGDFLGCYEDFLGFFGGWTWWNKRDNHMYVVYIHLVHSQCFVNYLVTTQSVNNHSRR